MLAPQERQTGLHGGYRGLHLATQGQQILLHTRVKEIFAKKKKKGQAMIHSKQEVLHFDSLVKAAMILLMCLSEYQLISAQNVQVPTTKQFSWEECLDPYSGSTMAAEVGIYPPLYAACSF